MTASSKKLKQRNTLSIIGLNESSSRDSGGKYSPNKRRRTGFGKGAVNYEDLTTLLIKVQNLTSKLEDLEKKFEKWASYSNDDGDSLPEEEEEHDINTTPTSIKGRNLQDF